jgi:cAMP-binding proteins - catabolite gene activator and regulatory subunit of cAMP-dependent protein kinases
MKKVQLTESHKEKLFQIPLFRDLPLNIKLSLLEKLDFVIYSAEKKEVVVTQGTPCNKLYVLLEGKLRTDIIDGLGNEVMIEYIIAPRTFATPHLFSSNNTLPATFTALENSVLLMATKESTFKVISQDPQVLHNFLCIAGNCNICTVSRLKPLSRKTVRERFIVYLYEYKKKDSPVVDIMHTQSQLAEYLNVSRPALSKEINKMIKERLITMDGKRIEILDKIALEKYL